jgi:hypothetical protein
MFELHLKAALLLVKEFRFKCVQQDLDPRAVRIALKYALKIDDYLAKQHGLTQEEEQKINEIAEKLFQETPQIKEKQK